MLAYANLVQWLWPALIVLTIASLARDAIVRPQLLDNYRADPVGWIIPAAVIAALIGVFYFTRAHQERNAFLASCLYLVAMLCGAAFALYPSLLPASGDPANSITLQNASAGASSLSIGLVWWSIGMAIAVAYFIFVYSMFKGKVQLSEPGH